MFSQVQLPQQRVYNGVRFPIVLSPDDSNTSFSLTDFTEAIRSYKPWLLSHLHDAGAVLFRGFPIMSASDFNDVVEAFGFEDHPYLGGTAPRKKVAGRIFTANESPPDQRIHFHHEMAYVPDFPKKVLFFCEVEPRSGGETPIILSHVVFERIEERHPEFVQDLEEHGLLYVRTMGNDDATSSAAGRGWKSSFLTEYKTVAEERANKLGMKLKWLEEGVKVVIGPVPAIKYDETRQRQVWFNSVVGSYATLQDAQNGLIRQSVTFGNGKPLPAHIIYDCQNILEEECVAIPWKKGDVMLLDNWAVLHSRRSFDPPCSVLASLCK